MSESVREKERERRPTNALEGVIAAVDMVCVYSEQLRYTRY